MNERICWVITGAGHFLAESVQAIEELSQRFSVDLFFTRAGKEVVLRYGLRGRLDKICAKTCDEVDSSSAASVHFSSGRYRALVIAPATANSVTKFALGIADSLASNFFAQAGKSRVRIIVLPTDCKADVVSITPSGRPVAVFPRPVDLKRTRELSAFPNVQVAEDPDVLSAFLNGLS